MCVRLKVLIPLLLFVIFSTQAMDSYYLEGTLGKSKIYMHIDDYTEDYPNDEPRITDVRYFYEKSLKDIPLEGYRSGSVYTLYFDLNEGSFKEKFVLTKDQNGKFTGTWTGENGKQFPVVLNKIHVETIINKYDHVKAVQTLKKSNPFEYVRTSKFSFVTDSASTFEGQQFRWISEVHSYAYGFYLDSTFSIKTLQIMNPVLEEILFDESLNELTCTSDWQYNTGGGIEMSVDFHYLDQELFSFSIFHYWSCGGPHDDFGKTCYLLDLSNGKNYSLEEVLSFDSSRVIYAEEETNFQAFSDYRSNFLAPHLIQLLLDQHLIYPDVSEEEDLCMNLCNLPESWTYPDWEYTKVGILFSPSVSRFARVCETDSYLLPFSVLEKWKVPSFPYTFPMSK
jgi:hypothetical protein